MRNEWFPRRVAEYVTDSQSKDLKARIITSERDFQFGVVDPTRSGQSDVSAYQQTAAQLRASKPAARTVEVEKLTVWPKLHTRSLMVGELND